MKSYDTLSEATDDLRKRGFTLNFEQDGNCLRCTDIDLSLKPEDFEIVEFHRFEGASNPSDTSVVYAVSTGDGQKGVLVDAYGAYSEAYSPAMLKKLDMRDR